MVLLLEVEGKNALQVREFAKVEAALRGLDPFGPHSYASLTRQDGSYVQVAGGKQKCLIEKREVTSNTHWRGHRTMAASDSAVQHVLIFGAGQMTLTDDEVFTIDDVIPIWRSFFEEEPFALDIGWRDVTDVLR
ncbi:hypothetical protein [Pseudosulfitobacter koreensis]|uniref:Uncharacterized protein n=1 Tax=Pseudosulfitobacter koreensis TaxID=2968472 RepID=A0ABT1Z072_9RHOB|nr:hypothetical protein [Pseudosulfitobacter koreense]MCR8826526.1 hypothetical protein [Pseudosulfitobacter koreense]